jgi:hypothetical protein
VFVFVVIEQHENIKFCFKHGKIAGTTSNIFETLMEMKVCLEWLKIFREVSEDLEIIQGLIGRQQLCFG